MTGMSSTEAVGVGVMCDSMPPMRLRDSMLEVGERFTTLGLSKLSDLQLL